MLQTSIRFEPWFQNFRICFSPCHRKMKIGMTLLIRTSLLALLLSLTFQNLGAAPIPGKDDRIGWSADGNRHDPDDWGATAMALAIFAKQGWQDKLVHLDYNNWLAGNTPEKSAKESISVLEGTKKFKFTHTKIFDCQTDLEASVDNAVIEINKSHEGSKFWYVQAGPFEVAYRARLKAKPEYRWVYSRFKKTAEHKTVVLNASDGGMAFCLATGDLDGNFSPKLSDFLGTDWTEPASASLKIDTLNSHPSAKK